MTERRAEDIRKAIDGELSGVGHDPFLYQRILNSAREEPPRRRMRKLTVALVALAVLVLSAAVAVATNWLGVRYFLTERLARPVPVEAAYVVSPAVRSFDSERFALEVMDAYWYADARCDRLDVTMHIDVKDPSLAFCFETDIGTDGESFDLIWWDNGPIPVTQWLDGRIGYVLDIMGETLINGRVYYGGIDYIWEEQGLTLLVELRDPPDLSEGGVITVNVGSWIIEPSPDDELGYTIGYDDKVVDVLTVDLPPMTKGPAPEEDERYEPNL